MKRRSWLGEAWERFRSNRLAMIGVFLIGLFMVAAIIHPILMATVWDRATYHPVHGHDSVETELAIVYFVTDPESVIDVMRARMQIPLY